MNHTERNDTRRAERRARAWAERAREQLAAVEARLGERYARHLAARRDPRDAGEVLRQLAARRLLPLGHGLRQASAHDVHEAPAVAGARAGHGRPRAAFARLVRGDRDALWPLREAGGAPSVEPDPRRAEARRAALRRMAEALGALRSGRAGVGGID